MATARDVIMATIIISVMAIALFTGNYFSKQFYNKLNESSVWQNNSNLQEIIVKEKQIADRSDYIILWIFVAMMLALVITGYLVGGHPIFTAIYFFVIVISALLAMVFSNTYQTLITNAVFGTTSASFPITTHIMHFLPAYIIVFGFMGMFAMYAKSQFNVAGGL